MSDHQAIAMAASHAELLDADACAFLLCIRELADALLHPTAAQEAGRG